MDTSVTESWKQLEGQVLNGEFPLREYLGGVSQDGLNRAGVFLTEYGRPVPQKATIKLLPLNRTGDQLPAELQLSLWREAAGFADARLITIFQAGRCRVQDTECLYVVMEYAEENLGQILPQRALSGEEAREMLGPVLDGLAYLHGGGFAHARLRPANVLAVKDQLKLSSDGVRPIGEPSRAAGLPDPYAPPETDRGWFSTAGDVWSLGMTLVESLTQQLPVWDEAEHWEPTVPEAVPEPFLTIARGCLRRDPSRRLSIQEIAAQLQHTLAHPGVAAQSASGAQVAEQETAPAKPAPAESAAKEKPARAAAASASAAAGTAKAAAQPQAAKPTPQAPRRFGYLVPVLGAFAVAAILVPRLLHRPVSAPSAEQQTAAPASTKADAPNVSVTASATTNGGATERSEATPSPAAQPSASAPPEAAQPAPNAAATTRRATGSAADDGQILDQVLPNVPERARATITGVLKLSVKVHVDAAGAVSSAELENPGPSQYFAKLALEAARRWKFSPAESSGSGAPSDWTLHFEFTREGTHVIPTQDPR